MFKVTTSCFPACTQPYYPLVSGFVDDAQRDARPRVNQALLQVVDVVVPSDHTDFSSFAAFKRTVQQIDLSTFLLCY